MGDLRRVAFARPIAAVFVATVMGYAIWVAFTGHSAPTGLRVGFTTDSYGYMRDARNPVWTRAFLTRTWGGPFPFLLLAKLCARNLRAIVIVQSVIAAGAWLLLAHTVGGLVEDVRVRTAAFVAILLVGLSPTVLQWNATILTESLSISLLAITVALLLRVVVVTRDVGARDVVGRDVVGRDLVGLLVAIGALAFVHDTNAYVLVAVAPIVALGAVRPRLRHRALAIAATCLLAGGVGIGLADRAQRWYQPLVETISVRVLPSATVRNYFIAHGMPWGPAVLPLEGQYTFRTAAFADSPDLAPFRSWLEHHGRATYLDFLASHPGWAISQPVVGRAALFSPSLRRYSSSFHDEPRGAFRVVGAIGFPGSEGLVELWCAAALVAGIALARRRESRAVLGAVAVVGALAIAEFFVSWHGDAFEIDRHAVTAAVALRMVVLIVSVLALDGVVRSRRRTRVARASRSPGRNRSTGRAHLLER